MGEDMVFVSNTLRYRGLFCSKKWNQDVEESCRRVLMISGEMLAMV
jgi:hypothetical protein